MLKRKTLAVLITVALLGATCQQQGCAGSRLAPPPQLSPVGDVAYYARTAIKLIGELQSAAIDGEAAGAIKTDDARKIIEATKTAGQAGVELANALQAGQSATTAKARAVAMIRQALTDLVPQLDPHARAIVQPYVTGILTLLAVFG